MDYFRLIPYMALGKLRRIYFMALPENKQDMKRSRMLYTCGDSAAQTIVQLSGGAFLVALMSEIGISDGNMGIILSVSSLAAVFQMLFMNFVQNMKKRKLFICFSNLQKIWLAFVFWIPGMMLASGMKVILFLLAFFYAQICIQVCTPAATDWIASLVPARLRGRYFALKDTVAVFVTVSGMLVVGIAFDALKKQNKLMAFEMVGGIILVLVIVNVISFSRMKEPRMTLTDTSGKELHGALLQRAMRQQPQQKSKERIGRQMKRALSQGRFRMALILNCLWMFSFYIASPFNSSYQVKELGLSYTFIMVVNFLANMVRVSITPRIGRRADQIGMAKMLKYVLVFYLLGYVFMICARPGGSLVFYLLSALTTAVSWSFISIGLLGIQLECMDRESRTIQYTILAVLSGVVGFTISMAAGRLLNWLQHLQLFWHGQKIYAQQITNALGVIGVLITILYLQLVVQKVRPVADQKDGKVV